MPKDDGQSQAWMLPGAGVADVLVGIEGGAPRPAWMVLGDGIRTSPLVLPKKTCLSS